MAPGQRVLPGEAAGGRLRAGVISAPELIPAHGLRLLPVTVQELPADRAQARELLEVRIAALGPDPAPPRESAQTEYDERVRPVASAVASLVRPVSAPAATPPPACA